MSSRGKSATLTECEDCGAFIADAKHRNRKKCRACWLSMSAATKAYGGPTPTFLKRQIDSGKTLAQISRRFGITNEEIARKLRRVMR